MSALTLLEDLHQRGVTLTVSPEGQLRYRAPRGVLSLEQKEQIRQHRAELLAHLRLSEEAPKPTLPAPKKRDVWDAAKRLGFPALRHAGHYIQGREAWQECIAGSDERTRQELLELLQRRNPRRQSEHSAPDAMRGEKSEGLPTATVSGSSKDETPDPGALTPASVYALAREKGFPVVYKDGAEVGCGERLWRAYCYEAPAEWLPALKSSLDAFTPEDELHAVIRGTLEHAAVLSLSLPEGAVSSELERVEAEIGKAYDVGDKTRLAAACEQYLTFAGSAIQGQQGEEWDDETKQLITWFRTALASGELPTEPFTFSPGVRIADPEKFFPALCWDIDAGPKGGRAYTGALQADLKRLYVLFGPEHH